MDKLKNRLINSFGIEDNPETWTTVMSQLIGTPATRVRKKDIDLIHVAHRLNMNKTIENERRAAIKQLEEKLKNKLEEFARNEKEAEDLIVSEPSKKESYVRYNVEMGSDAEKAFAEISTTKENGKLIPSFNAGNMRVGPPDIQSQLPEMPKPSKDLV